MRAEYDHNNNRVVAIENDNGQVTTTTTARVLGAETEWVPARIEYPEGYDQRFNSLLNPMQVRYDYEAATNEVVIRYPEADYSPAAIRQELVSMIKSAARQMLNMTDWVIIRSFETGEEAPDDIRSQRAAIRSRSEEFEEQLKSVADADLTSFTFSFDTEAPNDDPRPEPEPVKGADGREWVTDASSPEQEGNPVQPIEEQAGYVPETHPVGLPGQDGQIGEIRS